jgi:gas vesicle protein
MAEYDRYENESGSGFMMGLLTGTVIGAGIGMLLAPKAGSDLRGQVAEQAKNFGTKATEQWGKASEAAAGWAEKGREVVNQAREAVNRGAEEARGYVGSTTGSTYSSGTTGFGDRPTTDGTDYTRS